MYEQLITEFPSVNVSGIAVKLEQLLNMDEQLVTESGIIKVSGIAAKFEHM